MASAAARGSRSVGRKYEDRRVKAAKPTRGAGTRPRCGRLINGGPMGPSDRTPFPTSFKERAMAFSVPPLPYDYNALEPHIDEQTMHLHHDKHHQAYVTNANAALEGTEWADKSVEEVLRNLQSLPEDKRNPVR